MKVYKGKGGAYVTFEKQRSGMWEVRLRTGSGDLADKVRCDDYRVAIEYRKAFIKTARANRA